MHAKRNKHWGGGWLAFALLFGMLIWVRLRLVTDIPRAAYAEPAGPGVQHAHQPPAAQGGHEPEPDPLASAEEHSR